MKGVAPPTKRDFEAAIEKRLFIPKGGRPVFDKRFNRVGTAGAKVNSLVEDDDAEETPELSALAHTAAGAAKKKGKAIADAARKGRKGKGGNGAGNANAGGNANTGSTSSSSSSSNLTPAVAPTANNSLGLDIE